MTTPHLSAVSYSPLPNCYHVQSEYACPTVSFINIDESETRIRKAGPELREHWLMELKSEINTRFENYYKDYPPVVDPLIDTPGSDDMYQTGKGFMNALIHDHLKYPYWGLQMEMYSEACDVSIHDTETACPTKDIVVPLVDTPGFDDMDQTSKDILEMQASGFNKHDHPKSPYLGQCQSVQMSSEAHDVSIYASEIACPTKHIVVPLPLVVTPGIDNMYHLPDEEFCIAMTEHGRDSFIGLKSQNVEMFSKAHDVSICNSEINNVGGDLTINNYNIHLQPDLEPVQLSTWDHWTQPFFDVVKSRMFHAAERVKKLLPHPFLTMLDITLEEKVAEDALKYPPLLNAKVLLSKTSLYIPGVMNQLLSSVRYSFFSD